MTIPEEAVTALREGKKIDAIRVVRKASGIGLKEAKEQVEGYMESNTEVAEAFERNKTTPMPSFSSLVILACVLVIIYFLFTGG